MTKALVELLTSLFTADELRRFAAFLPGANVVAALPSGTASLEMLAFEMVQALERRGQIDGDFFARLEEERPGRKAEIAQIRAQVLDSNVPALDPPISEHSSKHASLVATWSPRHVHSLQRARHFVARQEVLARLRTWYATVSPQARVVALIGMGGAGKTAMIERFLAEHIMHGGAPNAGGVLVWSFFENPRTEEFLAEAVAYFASADDRSASAITVDALERVLAAGPPHLLVLDGLETVQSEGTVARAFGELEDPVLRRLLAACARGLGRSRVLVSSRFELSDLAAWEGEGLATIRVEPLAETDGVMLLRRWGVRGDAESPRGRFGFRKGACVAVQAKRDSDRPRANEVRRST